MKKMEEIISETAVRIRKGDEKRVRMQHEAGKLTARERIAHLLDTGSFMETETLRKDSNVVTGFGTVHSRPVYCIAQDYASQSGAMTQSQAEKIVRTLRLAQQTGAPVVLMPDSAGVKVTEGPAAMPAYASVLAQLAHLSGVSPILCYLAGKCTGIAAFMTQLADITVHVKKNGTLALHSAAVMNTVKGKTFDAEELFGAETMSAQGAVALKAEDEITGITMIKQLLDALPASNLEDAPLTDSDDLNRLLVRTDANDIISLVTEIADDARVLELFSGHGKAAHTLFCRIGGRSLGLIATDPSVNGGRIDAFSCAKIARFVRLCDSFSMPLVTLLATDGLAVPAVAEQAWYMRAASQMLYAYAEATCPKVSIIVGSAVGAAYVAMGGKSMADICYAWPDASVSPVTPEVAVSAFCDAELSSGADRAQLETEYREKTNAVFAAENALVDEVILPEDTRKMLIAALEYLSVKRIGIPAGKHGNMPL